MSALLARIAARPPLLRGPRVLLAIVILWGLAGYIAPPLELLP